MTELESLVAEANRSRELIGRLDEARHQGPVATEASFWACWAGLLAGQLLRVATAIDQAGARAGDRV